VDAGWWFEENARFERCCRIGRDLATEFDEAELNASEHWITSMKVGLV